MFVKEDSSSRGGLKSLWNTEEVQGHRKNKNEFHNSESPSCPLCCAALLMREELVRLHDDRSQSDKLSCKYRSFLRITGITFELRFRIAVQCRWDSSDDSMRVGGGRQHTGVSAIKFDLSTLWCLLACPCLTSPCSLGSIVSARCVNPTAPPSHCSSD